MSLETPLFVFAHGAGAPSSHPWMQRWIKGLATIGIVTAFDYPYIKNAKSRPDPLPQLVKFHREVLGEARQGQSGPVVLIGKSLGARVACHVALEETVRAVVCLGYPLCGGGDPAKLRAEVLRALTTPILFVQGTRDRLCPLPVLERVRGEMSAVNQLHVVEGGDHSLLVTHARLRANGETQEEVDQRILGSIQVFLAS
ncbi:MAG: alpha/beta fold hydrolase [Verrucomicrobia bacterium]|nr:alpha/beta fold hydrolase [Verrucomicrobiota bacterium]MBV8376963.1 alpha/beta fold hydrolase [Verrucomicrobiota bacterium]